MNGPAFPVYTSGYSVGSAAAATTLTVILGPVGFTDTSTTGYPYRSFSSPWDAAREAANSRLLDGIHDPDGNRRRTRPGPMRGEGSHDESANQGGRSVESLLVDSLPRRFRHVILMRDGYR